MFPQPLTGQSGGVGEVFRTNIKAPGTAPPLKFLCSVIFLKIKRKGKQ
ncbi:TPA: terminase [Citrobacter freundii]|nr:terminase [Citrobacter freundii]